MTSKEQERKALEQIRKIVEGLGEGSYIGTAFEGCFEIASANIENDFACSMKERKEAAEFAEDKLRERVNEMDDMIKSMQMKIESMKEKLNESHELSENLAHKLDNMRAERDAARETSIGYWNQLREAETKLDEKEDEIIHLKAKLYDLMIKTA